MLTTRSYSPRRPPSFRIMKEARPILSQAGSPSKPVATHWRGWRQACKTARMEIHDISIPLRDSMPTYDGEPGPRLEILKSIAKGDPANCTILSLGSHTGTHVDAPSHFIDGAASVDGLPLDAFVGPAQVVEFSGGGHITAADLKALEIPKSCERLLFKTRNSGFWKNETFRRDFSAVAPDAARELASRRLRLVGIDYLSIEPFDSDVPNAHLSLLSSGCAILEGLNLDRVEPGAYFLVCAPLNVVGAEGAPARAVLIDGLVS